MKTTQDNIFRGKFLWDARYCYDSDRKVDDNFSKNIIDIKCIEMKKDIENQSVLLNFKAEIQHKEFINEKFHEELMEDLTNTTMKIMEEYHSKSL
jgi:hypothetical protein